MIQIKLDIWVEDSFSKMKLPSNGKLSEALQIFAEKEEDKIRFNILSKKFIRILNAMNQLLKRLDKKQN